jgi:hypothetical protein
VIRILAYLGFHSPTERECLYLAVHLAAGTVTMIVGRWMTQ